MQSLFLLTYILLGIITVFIGKLRYGSLINFITLFCGWWSTIGFFSNLGLYNIYLPSTEVNLIMIIGILVFFLSHIFLVPVKFNITNLKVNIYRIKDIYINHKLLFIINGAAFISFIPIFLKSLILYNIGGFTYLRTAAYSNEAGLIDTTLGHVVLSYIIAPVFSSTVLLGVVAYRLGLRQGRNILLIGFIEYILYSFAVAARMSLFYFILTFYFSYLIINKYNQKNTPFKIKSSKFILGRVIVILSIIFILVVMGERSIQGASFLENLYIYFFAGPAYLTQLLNNQSVLKINADFLWGSGTFGFLTNIYSFFMTYIQNSGQGSMHLIGSKITSESFFISPNQSINAMCTVFYVFLADWGYIGVVVGPIVLAVFSRFLIWGGICGKKILWIILLIMWCNILFATNFRLNLIDIGISINIFFMILFTKKFKF